MLRGGASLAEMAHRVSGPLARRRAKVALAIVVLGGAVTAIAVANVALLDVAGGAEDQVGGLSARLDTALPPRLALTSTPVTGTVTAPSTAPGTSTPPAITSSTATTPPARTAPATPTAPATAAATETETETEPDRAAPGDADHDEDSLHGDEDSLHGDD